MFYSETLPKSPRFRARAREMLDGIQRELAPSVLEDARLLLSEIVANAVEHVREDGDIEVRIELQDGVLRVEVLDPGPGFTYRRAPPTRARIGMGPALRRTARRLAGRPTATGARACGSNSA